MVTSRSSVRLAVALGALVAGLFPVSRERRNRRRGFGDPLLRLRSSLCPAIWPNRRNRRHRIVGGRLLRLLDELEKLLERLPCDVCDGCYGLSAERERGCR
jgi:hypothetical protein